MSRLAQFGREGLRLIFETYRSGISEERVTGDER